MASTISGIEDSFSSWDNCMSKAYCKWPVIAGIIIGSLIAVSIIICIARCLCFGAECCGCCISCFSCCCPSRNRRNRDYQQQYQPPPPAPYQQYPQYSSSPAPYYGQPMPYRGPQTAVFETPSKPSTTTRFNEDALPPMPSWNNAPTRHVEETDPVEMERFSHANEPQREHLLADTQQGQYQHNQYHQDTSYGSHDVAEHAYDNNFSPATTIPYHDYGNHQQHAPTLSPVSSYAPSTTMPPSYRTHDARMISPVQSPYNSMPARRPVQGSWRDV